MNISKKQSNDQTVEYVLQLNYNQLKSLKANFNLSYQELINYKTTLENNLNTLQKGFGILLDKKPEPKRQLVKWDYVLKEMYECQEAMVARKSYFKNRCKKLAEQAVVRREKYKEAQIEKVQAKERFVFKQAEYLSKLVEREFWRNCFKVIKHLEIVQQQKDDKVNQQIKLDTFTNKLTQLTEQIAQKLQLYNLEQDLIAKQKENKFQFDYENNKILYNELQIQSQYHRSRKGLLNRHLEIQIQKQEIKKEESIIICLFKTKKGFSVKGSTLEFPIDSFSSDCIDADSNIQWFREQSKYEQLFAKQEDELGILMRQSYLLKGVLRNYQLVGMQWMVSLQQKNMNGILADEMGLGKTIQTIATLAYLASNYGYWGPHLVIVPTSILVNWEIEFKRWCPAFKILTYFGSPKERKAKRAGWSQPNFFHVCITSYKLVIQDYKIFRRKRWQYMILDEAQHIKNFRSQRWQILLDFHTQHRLLLTGTPLQNDLGEVWSLLHFLMPVVFDNHQEFLDWFGGPIEKALQQNKEVHQGLLSKLHTILRPFVLRRLKKDVEKQLPSKTEVIIKCQLSRRQRYLYDEFICSSGNVQINSTDFVAVMNIVQQLRKVCNHPELFDQRCVESPFYMQPIVSIIPKIVMNDIQNNIFSEGSTFLSQIQNQKLQHFNLWIDSHQIIQQRQSLIPNKEMIQKYFNNLKQQQNQEVAKSSKLGYRWAEQRRIAKLQQAAVNFELMKKRLILYHGIYNEIWGQKLDFKKFFKMEKLRKYLNFIMPTIEILYQRIYTVLQEFTFVQPKTVAQTPQFFTSPFSNQFHLANQKLNELIDLSPLIEPFFPQIQRRRLLFPNKKFLIYDSGKLNGMLNLVHQLKSQGHKIIIFTQVIRMSKMLDILEAVLSMSKIAYLRLDGSTAVENRQRQVERFNQDPRITCFISSTRSGGIGINLTGADTVIFYDTDWNPAMDKQAQDRCHRIGQTRAVTIYRLITSSTIEENILLKSMQKRQLDMWVMESGMFSTESMIKNKEYSSLLSQNMDKDDFEKIIEKVEDNEDIVAAKQAQIEEKNYQLNGFEEVEQMNQQDDILDWVQPNTLPPIIQYGIKKIQMDRSEYQIQMSMNQELDLEEEILIKQDIKEIEMDEQQQINLELDSGKKKVNQKNMEMLQSTAKSKMKLKSPETLTEKRTLRSRVKNKQQDQDKHV